MQVNGIDHINVLVKDENLEKAMDFFCDVLGSRFVGPIDQRPNLPLRMAIDHRGFVLQSPTSEDHPFAKQIKEHGEGISSIAYRVPDIKKGVAELKANGLKTVCLPPGQGEITELPGLKSALFSGENAFGVPVELVEYNAASPVTIANCTLTHQQTWYKTAAEPLLKVEWFDHMHVRVHDIEAACSFFNRVFGANFVLIDQRKNGLPMRVAFDKATQIELLCPEKNVEVGDLNELLRHKGDSLDRAGFYISNFKEGIRSLKGRGMNPIKFSPEIIQSLADHGNVITDIHAVTYDGANSFGFEIELVNYDVLPPVATAYLGLTSKLPWFKRN